MRVKAPNLVIARASTYKIALKKIASSSKPAALRLTATTGLLIERIGKKLGLNIGFHEYLNTRFIFQPNNNHYPTLKEKGIPYEEVSLESSGKPTLSGYFLKSNSKVAILYLHGYSGSADKYCLDCPEIQNHIDANVLIVNYRGYGKSTGSPSRLGVIDDALRMYEFLEQSGFEGKNIVVFGMSLGSAVGAELAKRLQSTNKQLGGFVLLSPFSSLLDIARHRHPKLSSLVLNDVFNTEDLIRGIRCPVFIAAGDKDDKTPLDQSRKIFDAANKPKQLHIMPGISHNHLAQIAEEPRVGFLKALSVFLSTNLKSPPS